MKQKKIFLFAGIVALVASYAVFEYQQEQQIQVRKEDQSRLVFLKPDQINYLEFDTKNGKFTIEKTVDGWNIVSPFKDAANSVTVDQFIQALTTEKSKDVVVGPEQKEVDLSKFGLDQPLGTIVLKDNLGDSRAISVGTVKNYQGDAYVRVDKRNEVSVSSSTWFAKIEKKVGDFRDLRLLRFPATQIESFKVSKGKESFRISSKEGVWVSIEHPEMKLDQNRVRGFLTALSTTEGIEVILEKSVPKSQFQSWGFANPIWTADVTLSEGKNWQASLAKPSKDNIHRIFISNPEFVFKIAPSDQATLLSFDFDSFRDRFEPFLFDSNKVKKIEIKTDLKSFVLEKKKENSGALETWKLETEIPGFSFNQDALIDFVNKLPTLSVHDFTSLKSHPSLEKSAKSIVVKDEAGNSLFAMDVGVVGNVYYVKTNKYPYVFSISEEEYRGLKLEQILGQNAKKESP